MSYRLIVNTWSSHATIKWRPSTQNISLLFIDRGLRKGGPLKMELITTQHKRDVFMGY